MSNFRDLWYDWMGLNTWLFKKANEVGGFAVYDAIVRGISRLGDEKMIFFYVIAIAVVAAILFIVRIVTKKGGGTHYLLVWLSIFLTMGGGLASAYYTHDYIKRHASYPRPYVALQGQVRVLEPQPADRAYLSFPSMHVMLISILVISLWPLLNEYMRWAGIWLTVAIAWSRMAVGVHYPVDVLGGFIMALVYMLLIKTVIRGVMELIMRILYRN